MSVYDEVIAFIIKSGQRLAKEAGKIQDIGVTKKFLTHEDLAIERGLKKIIKKHDSSHELFAEEENFKFIKSKNIWVADPISGDILVCYAKNNKIAFENPVYKFNMFELFDY